MEFHISVNFQISPLLLTFKNKFFSGGLLQSLVFSSKVDMKMTILSILNQLNIKITKKLCCIRNVIVNSVVFIIIMKDVWFCFFLSLFKQTNTIQLLSCGGFHDIRCYSAIMLPLNMAPRGLICKNYF